MINALTIGGGERTFVSQVRTLSRAGWRVHVALLFKTGELRDELIIPADHVHVLSFRSVFDIGGYFRARRLVRAIQPDVVYSTLNEANAIARVLSFVAPRYCLITREANMADVKPFFYKTLDVLTGFRSQAIIAVSGAVRDSLLSYAPHLASRVRILHNAVHVPLNPPEHVRQQDDAVRILSVGSLDEKKDHEVLVRALAQLPGNFSLTIVGKGVLGARLARVAAEVGVTRRVRFAGAMPPSNLAALYASHDILALPSRREGCPNVVLEAYAAAIPVIAFDIPGIREFVTEKTGILVNERSPKALARAIESEFSEHVKIREMGRAGYELAKSAFAPDLHNRSLLQIIHSCCQAI